MQIVSQSAPVSYSHFPPPLLMLSAPRIAGLLPARIPRRPIPSEQEIILKKFDIEAVLSAHGIPTPDELDVQFDAEVARLEERYRVMRDDFAKSEEIRQTY